MIVARFWLGSVIMAIRCAKDGVKRNVIYFRYGPKDNDWYSGVH